MEKPDQDELLILKNLLTTSTIDELFHEAIMANIDECDNYEDYTNMRNRLEDLQPSIHEMQNPKQRDITNHIKKLG